MQGEGVPRSGGETDAAYYWLYKPTGVPAIVVNLRCVFMFGGMLRADAQSTTPSGWLTSQPR